MKKSKYEIAVELTTGGLFKAKGDTALDALLALEINWTQVKSKGTITLRHGNKSSSKLFYAVPLRRIITNKLLKPKVARDLAYLLK